MALTFVSRANAVPIVLTGPTRYQSATQAHAAGNLLVAVFHLNGGISSGQITSVINSAGDLWIRSALSPYFSGTIHHHEVWYVLKTLGHPTDVLTITLDVGAVSLAMTIYEFAPSGPLLQALYVGDAAANIQVDGGTPPTINSGIIAVTTPSVLVTTYRDSISPPNPTSPSCLQFGALNSAGATNLFDGYQPATVPAAVTAIAGPINSFPQWSILASAFTELGAGCPQDLPAIAGTVGVGGGMGLGCVQDLPSAAGGSGVGCTSDLPTG